MIMYVLLPSKDVFSVFTILLESWRNKKGSQVSFFLDRIDVIAFDALMAFGRISGN